MAFVDISPPIYVSIPKNNGMTVEMPRHPGAVVPIPSGAQGLPGEPGFSPVVSVEEITGGNRVTITDADGDTTFDVMNGAQGEQGEPGEGVPSGGATGQVLKKRSNADYDTEWANESGTVLSVNGQTGAVVLDSTDIDHDGEPISDILGGEQTASGNIVTFTDTTGGNPITALSVAVEPVQSGSGDPSPTNVRPISGFSSVNIWDKPTHDTSATPTATIQLGQTVYGGTLDVINGKMTVDRVGESISGGFVSASNGVFYRENAVIGPAASRNASFISSLFKTRTVEVPGSWGVSAYPNQLCFQNIGSNVRLLVYTNHFADVSAFNAELSEHPLSFCLSLATPIELTLTPTQIQTLVGENVVWSDAGDVALSVSTGLIGAVETIPTATSELTNDSGFVNDTQAAAAAPVQSVNGQTGNVSAIPSGGTEGQVLAKSSGADYDTEWKLPLSIVGPLWTNPNPTASFAAQTISLDLSSFDKIFIKLRFGSASGSAENAYFFEFCDIGETTALHAFNVPNTTSSSITPNMAARNANVSNSGVAFGAGLIKQLTSGGNPTNDNTACIPYAIYGIKGIQSL